MGRNPETQNPESYSSRTLRPALFWGRDVYGLPMDATKKFRDFEFRNFGRHPYLLAYQKHQIFI
jgi:hypothetical protein